MAPELHVAGVVTGLVLLFPVWLLFRLGVRTIDNRYGTRRLYLASIAVSALFLVWFFFGHHVGWLEGLYQSAVAGVDAWADAGALASWLLYTATTIAVVLVVAGPFLVAIAASPPDGAGDSHGSARFMGRSEVNATTGPLQLGSWKGSKARYRTAKHVLTVAPTGAGKGIGCVLPTLLDYPGSVVVLDPKGEAWAVTHRHRETLGPVHVIDPWRETAATERAGVDLLASLDTSSPDCISRAKVITDALVVSNRTDDCHWDDTAQSIIQGLLLHLTDQTKQSARDLRNILMDPKLLEKTLGDMTESSGAHGTPSRSASAFQGRPDRERGSVLSTAQRHTEFLEDPRLAEVLSRDDIRWSSLKEIPQTVYLVIPPAQLRAQSRFVRVLLALAMAELTTTKPGTNEVLLLLDEVAQLGHFAALEDAIAIVRGYGVRLWALVQDLSQLKAVYPKWETFLANTTLQAFGTQDQYTARYLSEALGNQTIMVESNQTSGRPGELVQNQGKSSAPTGRALLTPDEVRTLSESTVLVLEQSKRPARLSRLNYLEDSTVKGRWDANPMHASG